MEFLREPPYKAFTVGIQRTHFYEFAEWDGGHWLSALDNEKYLAKLEEMTKKYGKPYISLKMLTHTVNR